MIAYKGFLPGLICRGYQFRMGLNVTEKANCAHIKAVCTEGKCVISDFNVDPTAFYNIYKTRDMPENIKSLLCEGNESGEGVMQCFEIAPGIQITYNDLNMDSCFRPLRFEKNFLQINHCLEGCYECELEGGAVSFLGEGDLCVDYLSKDKQVFLGSRIPLKKYRGITVLLEMETAQRTLDSGFQQANINLEQIKDRLCSDGRSLIIKSKHEIDHIFSELYSVDERIQIPYFWIKVIELLLFLSLLDGSSVRHPQQFSADISKRTQEVYQYIIENPFMKETIPDLAYMFGVLNDTTAQMRRTSDGWTLTAHGLIRYENGTIEWNYSRGVTAVCYGGPAQSRRSIYRRLLLGSGIL